MKPRIVFLSTFDYPSRFAHAIHGLEMARALSKISERFVFVCNTAVNPEELKGIDWRALFGPFGRRVKKLRLRSLLFLPAAFVQLITIRPKVIYTTEPGLYRFARILSALFGARFIAECHGALAPRQARVLARADRLVFTTEGLRSRFVQEFPGTRDRATVLPNAVDVTRFDAVSSSPETLRDALSLPQERFLIGYIGRFEPLGLDKGLKHMIDSLVDLSLDTDLVLVGAAKKEAEDYAVYAEEKGMSARVRIVPHVASAEVPKYAKACDVLCYVPPSNDFTETETSPMKIFEYMAAGRPIIVSDTKAMHEILHDDEAIFVTPGDRAAFVAAVTNVRNENGEALERARRARIRVSSMTWDKRVERIVQFVRGVV